MRFDVVVLDRALDSLPQDLSFDAFDCFLDSLEIRLAADPLNTSERAIYPGVTHAGKVYEDKFLSHGAWYLFKAYFWFREERYLDVWNLEIIVES